MTILFLLLAIASASESLHRASGKGLPDAVFNDPGEGRVGRIERALGVGLMSSNEVLDLEVVQSPHFLEMHGLRMSELSDTLAHIDGFDTMELAHIDTYCTPTFASSTAHGAP
eukprot:1355476-Amorphochlora_amoeboformis.AAC.1